MKRSRLVKFLAPTVSAVLMAGLIGCSNEASQETNESSNNNEGTEQQEERFPIDIMTMNHQPEPPTPESPVWQAIEDYTNTEMNIQFVPSASYEERFNITLASGNLPHIMLTEQKSPSFINAVKDGAFWDLTDYLDEYESLSQMNDIVKNNISIDGRIYGIYRSRPLGRNATIIRQDWLDNLGMDIPETIDDFYDALYAFTYDDPDGNGQDDTYGMVVTEYEGPWDIMQTWFGVPNKWGEDSDGKLIPHFMTDEYREALTFFKKLYDEGLVNEDFAVMDPAQWSNPIVNGEAGVQVNVADEANRIQNKIWKENPDADDVMEIFRSPKGPNGHFNLPTQGYAGMFAISKTSVKTEDDLRRVLQFLDDLNSEEGQILANNGLEGQHYNIVDGELDQFSLEDDKLVAEYQDLNQLQMFIPEDRFLVGNQTRLNKKSDEIIAANEEIVVGNPAEPYISEVYAQRGQQLDNIIRDARIQFIVGQIDEQGLDEAVELWLRSGGEDYIAEINQLHEQAQ
ncbi:extracellular solute-binding protein [Halalkalibacter urbisdiaboli]|uniref:extracellular solute-binding protein n=1 Tax=Halalkalibacter urbisdiaboli TaxID=1960589 RepID=UPI000B45268F|nr:extracellular solute-binding protein [Halalkalibacter urbisdiaboli]